MDEALDQFLRDGDLHPVLVDVGASGGPPGIWQTLAKHAVHVAFDPDLREMKQESDGTWHRSTILNEVIAADASAEAVQFNLTRSPYCSSTLRPDAQLVGNFFGAERFEVLKQVSCKATTLDAVMDRLGLDRIDWLKLDTQGTDLRIYNSLSAAIKRNLLAIDLEPGLRGAYHDEDLFGDVHRDLRRDGFWLSNAKIQGFVRMRSGTLEGLRKAGEKITQEEIEKAVRKVPGWIEIRYLRSLESMAARSAGAGDYQLLWVFAMLDGNFGFALDVAAEYAAKFSADKQRPTMRSEPLRRIRASLQQQRKKEEWDRSSLAKRGMRKIAGKIRAHSKNRAQSNSIRRSFG